MSPSLRRALVLVAAFASGPTALAAPHALRCDDGAPVPVAVRETPERVRLSVRLPPGSDPGRVEVRLDRRTLLVVAQDADGHALCSAITLAAPATEAGALADYDGEGELTITLRRPGP